MGKLAELDRPMNLYLIGYRGSGKTTVAACLSKELGLPWVDADQQLVLRVGKSIAQIFSDDGEPAFRNHESETLKLLSQGTAGIVALGGGVILRPENRQVLRETGRTVWLKAEPEVLAARLEADAATKENRPSLTSQGVLGEVQTVLEKRRPLYAESADFEVAVDHLTPAEVASQIAHWWKLQTTGSATAPFTSDQAAEQKARS